MEHFLPLSFLQDIFHCWFYNDLEEPESKYRNKGNDSMSFRNASGIIRFTSTELVRKKESERILE